MTTRGSSGVGESIRTLFQVGSVGGLSDGQLLERFRSRDPRVAEPAFAALVERHGPMVLGVCRRLLADEHLAEDAFQATFLILARRASSVRNLDAFGGWLHRVARRVALRSKIRTDRRKTRERPEVREVAVSDVDHAAKGELRAVIDKEINRLADAQRLPVVLCCLEGLSHEEAAIRLRLPVGTLKSRLARGRQRLQERLLRRGFAPSVTAVGAGFLETEVSAAISTTLVAATARSALALAAGGVSAGGVSTAVSFLIREERNAMIAARCKLAFVALLTVGTSSGLLDLAVARSDPGPSKPSRTPPHPGERKVALAPSKPVPSKGVVLRVVDPDGRPVPRARIDVRMRERSDKPSEFTDEIGRYQALNLFNDGDTIIDIIDPDRPLGATIEVTQPPDGGEAKEQEVRLQPLVSLSGRVVDVDGKPIAEPIVRLYRNVIYLEQNERSYGGEFATLKDVDPDGSFTFERLIPGANYNVVIQAPGHVEVSGERHIIKPGAPMHLDEFRVPKADRDLDGILVDPGGNPVEGVSVVYSQVDRTRMFVSPDRGVWRQKSDASGRFHLTMLPQGPLRLMVYGENSGDSIKTLKYVDVPPGQLDPRIELPDPDDRLRGID